MERALCIFWGSKQDTRRKEPWAVPQSALWKGSKGRLDPWAGQEGRLRRSLEVQKGPQAAVAWSPPTKGKEAGEGRKDQKQGGSAASGAGGGPKNCEACGQPRGEASHLGTIWAEQQWLHSS